MNNDFKIGDKVSIKDCGKEYIGTIIDEAIGHNGKLIRIECKSLHTNSYWYRANDVEKIIPPIKIQYDYRTVQVSPEQSAFYEVGMTFIITSVNRSTGEIAFNSPDQVGYGWFPDQVGFGWFPEPEEPTSEFKIEEALIPVAEMVKQEVKLPVSVFEELNTVEEKENPRYMNAQETIDAWKNMYDNGTSYAHESLCYEYASYKENPCLALAPKNELNKCEHEWKSYTGLVESYNYCVKCDEKESKK